MFLPLGRMHHFKKKILGCYGLVQWPVGIFLFSCLVFKGLEMEKSKEFNFVENKSLFLCSLKIYRREIMKTSRKLKLEENWDILLGSVNFIFTKEVKQKMGLCFKKLESICIWFCNI